MKFRKFMKAIKTAGEYCASSSGGVAIILAAIGCAVIIPPFISFPLVALVGLVFGALGWYNSVKEQEERELRNIMKKVEQDLLLKEEESNRPILLKIKEELEELKTDLSKNSRNDSPINGKSEAVQLVRLEKGSLFSFNDKGKLSSEAFKNALNDSVITIKADRFRRTMSAN